MPVISQFYGIIIQMFFNEKVPNKQQKLVEAWIFIHQEELQSLWNLMQEQGEYFKIEPLK